MCNQITSQYTWNQHIVKQQYSNKDYIDIISAFIFIKKLMMIFISPARALIKILLYLLVVFYLVCIFK